MITPHTSASVGIHDLKEMGAANYTTYSQFVGSCPGVECPACTDTVALIALIVLIALLALIALIASNKCPVKG